MSYNISAVKVYEMDLRIPKKDMQDILELEVAEDSELTLNLDGKWNLDACEGEINGHTENGDLVFDVLEPYGEFSGTSWNSYLKDMLKLTKGVYKARFVWADGDMIYRVECVNGELTEVVVE